MPLLYEFFPAIVGLYIFSIILFSSTLRGGGGGGGGSGLSLSSYELEGKARTRPSILRVILGPYVQYCPCEVSVQKLGQKPKSELKEI